MKNKKKPEAILDNIFGKAKYTPGDVVRLKRKSWGLSQKEVSEITKISENNISGYENNRLKIGWEVANKLAVAIGVHPATIMFPNSETFNEELKEMANMAQEIREKKIKEAS